MPRSRRSQRVIGLAEAADPRRNAACHGAHPRVTRLADDDTSWWKAAPAALVEEEIDLALRAAMHDLPDRCREVFERSRVHGHRYAEIASTLGISVKTVEAQMGKALRILREATRAVADGRWRRVGE
jgi:RNA polymerase sigma factor (sigma-70 family)